MSAGVSRCPKCNGEMVQGFIFESQGPKRMVSTWVEGCRKVLLAEREGPGGQVRPGGHLPLLGVRVLGILLRGQSSLPSNAAEPGAAPDRGGR